MILLFWIIAINVLIITFFKYKTISALNTDVRLYVDMRNEVRNYKLPDYIRITDNLKSIRGFSLFGVYNNRYIYIDNKYMIKSLKKFVSTLMLWEFALCSILIFMVYIILKRSLKKEQEHKQFLQFLLGAISHKLGNFLSIQKINLSLIETKDTKPIERLEKAYVFMEHDFKNIIRMMKYEDENTAKRYDVTETINSIISLFDRETDSLRLSLSLSAFKISSENDDFYNCLYELVENSIKYSKEFIRIKTFKRGKYVYIILSNDIGKRKSGSGFGLSLVKYLSSRNGWRFETKLANNMFQAALIIEDKLS